MRNINELIGIINGISYDGIINKLEVARLSSWVVTVLQTLVIALGAGLGIWGETD